MCGSPTLAPDTVYEFRVQAETEVGPGPFSNSTQFTTPEDGTIIIVSTIGFLSLLVINYNHHPSLAALSSANSSSH